MSQADQKFSVTELSSHLSCGAPHCEVKPSGDLYELGRRMLAETVLLNAGTIEELEESPSAQKAFLRRLSARDRLEMRALRMQPRTSADALTLAAVTFSFIDRIAAPEPDGNVTLDRALLLRSAIAKMAAVLSDLSGIPLSAVGPADDRFLTESGVQGRTLADPTEQTPRIRPTLHR